MINKSTIEPRYLGMLLGVSLAYFVLARAGLALASINPSATPIWPPTGFAIAATLVWGYRVWPAIFVGAVVANFVTDNATPADVVIGIGNTLEAMIIAHLIDRWSDRLATFETPAGIARFAAFAIGSGTLVSATVGVTALAISGAAAWSDFGAVWLTWWLGDSAGALVVAPVVALWAKSGIRAFRRDELIRSLATYALAAVIGLIAFAPLVDAPFDRAPLAFFAIAPLLWAALRRGVRDTSTVVLIVSACAVWGTSYGTGPFARGSLNDSFLTLLAFLVGIAMPSLALAADIAARNASEERQRLLMAELDHRVRNILAVILATARLSRRTAASKDAYGESLERRIAAMASIHDLLTRRRWEGVSLSELVRETVRAHAASETALTIEGEECLLKPKQAIDLALVVHELSTNAAKHGALSAADGRVVVRWRTEATNGRMSRLVLLWWELDGPRVRFPTARGFGSQLIENALTSHGGSVGIDYHPDGVRCRIEVPFDERIEHGRQPVDRNVATTAAVSSLKAVRRVMIAEDEPVLGLELRAALTAEGFDVIGPARTLDEADSLAKDPAVAAAVLDVNLDGELVFPVAERLAARDVRIVFVSGYDVDAIAPEALRGTPVLQKPLDDMTTVTNALRRLLQAN